ncbi:Factor of DNA methylation 5 [Forsythia ovata]|uniref:Factor of DNA methylation 5 n=1 Tax=Forsythia ovata TaxID=205694 RepID=A0ABD1WYU2_9LAMI
MGSSSDEVSDISDSEIKEYVEKPFEELKTVVYKVKGPNGTLRCPFCAGKKKQYYQYNHLFQYATGVGGKGSSNRSAKHKASHLALAKYLETDLADKAEPLPQHLVTTAPAVKSEQNDLDCWPWTEIVTNILNEPGNGQILLFEKSFEAVGQSKKEWDEQRTSLGSNIYGWFAREVDYKSEKTVEDYLRKNG